MSKLNKESITVQKHGQTKYGFSVSSGFWLSRKE